MIQMIKEGKSKREIVKFFGKDKVKYHPIKKFAIDTGLPNWDIID
jgi:hypothetical protein